MATTFSHTNIVARDPERLAAFYSDVFGCVCSGPARHLAGEWLERGMGLPGAKLDAIHLALPGVGDSGATLELFTLPDLEESTLPSVNAAGLMHLAFAVDDIEHTLAQLLAAGGEKLGQISDADIPGVGRAQFIYTRDPEGNILELQEWKSREA
jgi:catechol 2,3-dioxygenase-like lactoylglutathione lyase family enzyme